MRQHEVNTAQKHNTALILKVLLSHIYLESLVMSLRARPKSVSSNLCLILANASNVVAKSIHQ